MLVYAAPEVTSHDCKQATTSGHAACPGRISDTGRNQKPKRIRAMQAQRKNVHAVDERLFFNPDKGAFRHHSKYTVTN
jgi:hypothetical protein